MSDDVTPVSEFLVASTEAPAEPTTAQEVLSCPSPGCTFKTTSPSGLTRHNTIQHTRKKVAKAVTEKSPAPKPNKPLFKELANDGNGVMMVEHRDGSWWVAKKVVV